MALHTPTMLLMIMVVSAVTGAAIAVIAYRRHPDLLLWSTALALHGLGYALYCLRGLIPDFLSIVVANMAIAAAFALFGEGLYRFQARQPVRWLLWLPVPLSLLGFSLLLHDQRARFMLAGLLVSAQSLVLLVTLWQRRRVTPGRGQYILATGLTLVLSVMLLRVLGMFLGEVHIAAVGDSHPVQSATFVISLVGLLLLAIGLVMMNQEHAEQALQNERGAEQFRSQILELLTSGLPLRQVLVAMVQGIERLHPGMLCSVVLLDRQGRHLAESVSPSLPDFYSAAINGLEIGEGVGSCGTAAFKGQRVVVEDIAHHPYWADYKALAARARLGACWSQPILSSGGKVLGTFGIYHREPHAPSPADIQLIEQSAALASIAIERSREAQELKQSEARYRCLINSANEGICVVQGDLIRFANPKLCELAGYPENVILGRSFLDFVHEDDSDLVVRNRRKRLAGIDGDFKYPVRVLTREHGVRWFELSGTSFEWEGQPATLNFLTDITDRVQMEERVRQFAYHDALTGLPNRRLLMDRLGLAMARHKRTGQHGALMFLDLDNFKPLNDRHGHDAGDLLLVEVAHRLKGLVRESDTVARFGGDEFVVILGDLDAGEDAARAHAMSVADKILSTLSEPYHLRLPRPDGDHAVIEHHCSASIGVALFLGEPGTEDDCIKQADGAMYQAKQAGRHTVRLSEPPRKAAPVQLQA
ncbi:MAG: diguanylate cyclase [Aquabacterium sp.]|uniref:sensor domain-containing diguanylate cyclase n=1 Tax=Aquabacterium sp. TaxID=1872578 RepID=UPI0025BB5829|nr:diguanylate cyclase [Aquabacterium sp.]MBI3382106.1 diguanylate cyclase [Aquabacterium sp.]